MRERIQDRFKAAAVTSAMLFLCPGDDVALSMGVIAQVSPHAEVSDSAPHDAVLPREIVIREPAVTREQNRRKERKSVRPTSKPR